MKIFVYDEFGPEDTAMMQALYSRSAKSVVEHVEKVKTSGSGKFMETFYVGYGHASIADCGSTTIFIEDVSMLVAKAIQDWPLYSGQETSSRYINMAEREKVDPVGTSGSQAILEKWMDFYTESQAPLESYLQTKYPRKDDEVEAVYLKAIKARSFDILRGFLPAGVTTQLSWHTNLRQASDKLFLLSYHPLPEVRQVAQDILSALKEKYGHSFSHRKFPLQEAYRESMVEKHTYFLDKNYEGDFAGTTTIANDDLLKYKDIITTRPEKTLLPLFLGELGNVTFSFLLDFGSFRDIQRHRNGVCRMPLLTTQFGFQSWYFAQLPPELEIKAKQLVAEQTALIEALETSPELKQYYLAMGFNVSCRVTYALPAAIYVVELRSGRLVHPTLRKVAHQMHHALARMFPELKLHSDLEKDDWDVRRGLQDIKEKETK